MEQGPHPETYSEVCYLTVTHSGIRQDSGFAVQKCSVERQDGVVRDIFIGLEPRGVSRALQSSDVVASRLGRPIEFRGVARTTASQLA
jgi:hypothetical protein